ncbi:MAG: hypothetical protein GY711_19230 [bacterium]|nr:hypothetical protein [bacterium]
MTLSRLALLLPFAFSPAASASDDEAKWRDDEAGILENHIQLTSSDRFRKAGECYFSPDGKQIIFQAIEKKANEADEERFYQMYVADLVFDGGRVVGTDKVLRLSPEGSSNTCGWFHPTERGVVIFGSTVGPPSKPDKAGYQRESSRYSWQFPQEMDIVRCELARADGTAATLEHLIADPKAYLAECVIGPGGRFIVYCEHRVAEGASGGDLLLMDLETKRTVPVAGGSGYDGGPFFSPDGKRICYRSDRRGNDLLQLFVSELAFDQAGNVLGVEREFQLTDNVHVNWAPYWHPSGRFLAYATSEIGHDNYEVFIIDADPGTDGGPVKYGTRRRRVTHAPKFDGLPVFTTDGKLMMWTSQRGADRSSQVWLADFVMPLDRGEAAPAEPKEAEPERMQAEDPATGLIYLYNPKTHELSVYDPKTHKERAPKDKDEIDLAMKLFRGGGEDR